jgi:hypothetical protein
MKGTTKVGTPEPDPAAGLNSWGAAGVSGVEMMAKVHGMMTDITELEPGLFARAYADGTIDFYDHETNEHFLPTSSASHTWTLKEVVEFRVGRYMLFTGIGMLAEEAVTNGQRTPYAGAIGGFGLGLGLDVVADSPLFSVAEVGSTHHYLTLPGERDSQHVWTKKQPLVGHKFMD